MGSIQNPESAPFLELREVNEDRNMSGNLEGLILQDAALRTRYLHNLTQTLSLMLSLLFGLAGGYLLSKFRDPFPARPYQIPAIPQTFQETPIYSQPPSNESNAAWAALIPVGRGFVEIKSGEFDATQEGKYCVSVFHQLHCLDLLRRGYYAAQNGVKEKATPTAADGGPVSPIPGDFQYEPALQAHKATGSHMHHCFDYLRQALICAADPSLEERDAEISGVRGWGTTHQCRDFENLKKWTERHRYTSSKGIAD